MWVCYRVFAFAISRSLIANMFVYRQKDELSNFDIVIFGVLYFQIMKLRRPRTTFLHNPQLPFKMREAVEFCPAISLPENSFFV